MFVLIYCLHFWGMIIVKVQDHETILSSSNLTLFVVGNSTTHFQTKMKQFLKFQIRHFNELVGLMKSAYESRACV